MSPLPVDLELVRALEELLGPERVHADAVTRLALARDASAYRLVPRVVVRPEDEAQVQALFGLARARGVPLTFRAAGTSLSGQAVTDGVLVDISRGWRALEVLDRGARVRAQPGVIGARVNAALRPLGRKLGPDPASIHACMLGGIVANNSSGMCCGTAENAYRTLESLRCVLPSGTLIDTADPRAEEQLAQAEPALCAGLLALRAELLADPALCERVRRKHQQKNTSGYGLNALLDFTRPLELLRHLLIGSEGTLAFISQVTLRSVPDLPWKRTGLLLFPDVRAACAAIAGLAAAGARALELLDRASLRAVAHRPGVPAGLDALPPAAAALLCELHCASPAEREAQGRALDQAAAGLPLLGPARWTDDPAQQAVLWRVRQGLFPAVGAARARGTAVLIEDVCFPLPRLADAVLELQALLAAHGYADAVVFGHARDGNLHFVLPQSFDAPAEVERYARFMDGLVALVLRHEGALKAEHGTGRNMAPFVEAEWGPAATRLMRRVKALCDPQGVLSPGVLLSDDPQAHLRHLKPLPEVDPEVDRCIECGFCEPRCPSRDLTLTPRQRIALRRELRALPAEERAVLQRALEYPLLETCAADGMCATACPVEIDTGRLVKRLRAEAVSPGAQRMARRLAGQQAELLEAPLRAGLSLAAWSPGLARAGHGLLRRLGLPLPPWPATLPPAPAGGFPATSPAGAAAVYLPTCPARLVGSPAGAPSLPRTLARLSARAALPVWIPRGARGTCCGLAWGSKGYPAAQAAAARRAVDRLWRWSGAGRLPVLLDASPCAQALAGAGPLLDPAGRRRLERLTVLDPVEWLEGRLLGRSPVRRRARRVAVHPVCSLVRRGGSERLSALVRALAEEPFLPPSTGCCGTAGDRGLVVPELAASATRALAAEVRAAGCTAGVSSSPTCEMGLAEATGLPWFHVGQLMEWATRP